MAASGVRILVVDDEEIVRESLAAWLRRDGWDTAVAASGTQALAQIEAGPWAVALVDLKMPGLDGLAVLEKARALRPETALVLMTAFATVDTAVRAMKLGAADYLVKPFDPDEVSLLVRRLVGEQAVRRENVLLRKALRKEHAFGDLVTESPAFLQVLALARAAARTASTVLVLGESGTGKEVLARALHRESPRAAAPFVAVSCAALTESLLESELFGYEKGAFTGAAARTRGKIECADRGTLFLDEIGDVTPKLQMDLLRVLESRQLFRVGGTAAMNVDIRVIAATNRDLEEAVKAGRFREDLFYRLNVVTLRLPPLRERPSDVPLLVPVLLARLCAEMGRPVPTVAPDAMQALCSHAWPGNVRELRNVLERALVVAEGEVLQRVHLGLPEASPARAETALASVERRHVEEILDRAEGNVSLAARLLDIDRVTLHRKMRRWGLGRTHDAS